MRILIVTGVYPPHIGGPAIQAHNFAKEYIRRGVDVRVLTYGPTHERGDGVRVEYLDHQSGGNLLKKLRRKLNALVQIRRIFREYRPSVVQIQTVRGLLPLMVTVVARRAGSLSYVKFAADPVADFLHSNNSFSADEIKVPRRRRLLAPLVRQISRLLFRLADFVWVTTPTMVDTLAKAWNLPRHQVIVAHNLVDLQQFENTPARLITRPERRLLRLLIVARLNPIKGIDYAMRALDDLKGEGFLLRVVGEGDSAYAAYLRDLAERLGLEKNIEWAGKVAPNEMAAEFERADMFIMPSRSEAFGVAIVEAMAAGLPVIAANVGGIPYVGGYGKYVRLFEPGNVEGLTSAIRELARDRVERERLIEAGRERARDFALQEGVQKWLDLFAAQKASLRV